MNENLVHKVSFTLGPCLLFPRSKANSSKVSQSPLLCLSVTLSPVPVEQVGITHWTGLGIVATSDKVHHLIDSSIS